MAARARTQPVRSPKARSDAYVGILALALLAQIAGAVFLFLDYNAYPASKPPAIQGAPTASAPVAPQPQQPAPQQPAPMPMP